MRFSHSTSVALLTAALANTLYGQGQLVLHNLSNTSLNPSATSNGIFWIVPGTRPVPITNDFNAAFYGGTDSSSLSQFATFLLSNGTAHGDNFSPGTLLDQSGTPYTFPSLSSVFIRIEAWTVNANSYAAAVAAGEPAAQSPIFVNPVSAASGTPSDLTGMPAIILSTIPEPSPSALAGLAVLCALLLRPRRTRPGETADAASRRPANLEFL